MNTGRWSYPVSGVAVRMLIAVRYFVDRLSQPRTRAEEVRDVRLRLAEQPGPEAASQDEARIALELRRLREDLSALFGDLQACGRCVRRPYGVHRLRSGRAAAAGTESQSRARMRAAAWAWPRAMRWHEPRTEEWVGGHCCSGPTRNLFTDEELAALRLSGTTPGVLRLPRGAHAGCAFRGPLGCSLDAAHRPCLCVRYTCRDLEAELRCRSSRSAVVGLQRELYTLFARFIEARRARLEREGLAELSMVR